MGFPGGSDGNESTYSAGDPDSIPGLERSPGEGYGYPLQYSCLENSTDRGILCPGGLQFMGCRESETTEQVTLSLSRKFYTMLSKLPLQHHMCTL